MVVFFGLNLNVVRIRGRFVSLALPRSLIFTTIRSRVRGFSCRFAFCVDLSDPGNNLGLDNVFFCDLG